jgi:hypothetical protein
VKGCRAAERAGDSRDVPPPQPASQKNACAFF